MFSNRLRILLIAHGFITLAAGFVLVAAPGFIPNAVGIHLEPREYLVAYLLAGAEFGFATLSFGGSRLTDPRAIRLIIWSCIAFHGTSGILEMSVFYHRGGTVLLSNIAARIIIIVLFAYLSRSDH